MTAILWHAASHADELKLSIPKACACSAMTESRDVSDADSTNRNVTSNGTATHSVLLPYVANALLFADFLQTRQIARSETLHETNVIMGRKPSTNSVGQYFLASAILINGAAMVFPAYSTHIYGAVATVEFAAVAHNLALHVSIKY